MNEIYSAIFSRLTTQLTPIVIYDYVPQDMNVFPYIRLDSLVLDNNDTDTELGYNGTIQIIGFSRYRGTKEANTMALNIYNALHRYVMADTASFGISSITEQFRTIVHDPDGITLQSVQRFQIYFENI